MKRNWRRWLQFSLRSYLIVSMLAVLGLWGAMYWLREYWPQYAGSWGPPPTEQKLPDGWVIQQHLRTVKDNKSGNKFEQRHGRFVLLDQHGRTRCIGRYEEDHPAGTWFYFHANGRRAMQGECHDGVREGKWSAWYENGHQMVEIEHGQPSEHRFGMICLTGGPFWPAPFAIAMREGPAQFWSDNGRIECHGQYFQDRREGEWTLFNRQGEKTALGNYVAGRRQGKWRHWNEAGEQSTAYYAAGRLVENANQLGRRLQDALSSSDDGAAFAAVDAIDAVGDDLIPQLQPALNSDRPHIARHALVACCRHHGDARRLLPEIKQLAQCADRSTQRQALVTQFAVETSQRRELLPQVLEHLASVSPERQLPCYEQLADLGPAIVPLLVELLDSEDAVQRRRAIESLAKIADVAFPNSYSFRVGDYPLWDSSQAALKRASQHGDPNIAQVAKTVLKAFDEGIDFGFGPRPVRGFSVCFPTPVAGSRGLGMRGKPPPANGINYMPSGFGGVSIDAFEQAEFNSGADKSADVLQPSDTDPCY